MAGQQMNQTKTDTVLVCELFDDEVAGLPSEMNHIEPYRTSLSMLRP